MSRCIIREPLIDIFDINRFSIFLTMAAASGTSNTIAERQDIKLSTRFLTASTGQQLTDIHAQMTAGPWPKETSDNHLYQNKWSTILSVLAANHADTSNRDNIKNRGTKFDAKELVQFVASRTPAVISRIDDIYVQDAGASMGFMAPEVSRSRHASAIIQALLLEVDAFIEERRKKMKKKKSDEKEGSITKAGQRKQGTSQAGAGEGAGVGVGA